MRNLETKIFQEVTQLKFGEFFQLKAKTIRYMAIYYTKFITSKGDTNFFRGKHSVSGIFLRLFFFVMDTGSPT